MKFHIITAFPKLFDGPLNESILKRAQEKNLAHINIYDLRDFTTDKHHQVDDYPYGGGPGMILKPEPIFRCMEHVLSTIEESESRKLIFLTPQGEKYKQQTAKKLTEIENIVLLCGHYKGVDERVREYWQMEEISIGDFVLTGGELPALIIVDSVVRLIPGVISDLDSAATDSFYNNLLDCPYYTRPEVFKELNVPSVLLSGHHAEIEKWRKQKAIERTIERRKDLLTEERLNDESGGLIDE
jgi:tRNA (guanine37-N1)-methyltransferase